MQRSQAQVGNMAQEMFVGFTILGVLLTTFAISAYWRLGKMSRPLPAALAASQSPWQELPGQLPLTANTSARRPRFDVARIPSTEGRAIDSFGRRPQEAWTNTRPSPEGETQQTAYMLVSSVDDNRGLNSLVQRASHTETNSLEDSALQHCVVSNAGRETSIDYVRADDSFWTISMRAFGTGQYFRALYEHNRARCSDPPMLMVGRVVDVPSEKELRRRYPTLCPGSTIPSSARLQSESSQDHTRSYVVKENDTLFDIARFELGQASRYVEVIQLNHDQLAGRSENLVPGTRLLIPQD